MRSFMHRRHLLLCMASLFLLIRSTQSWGDIPSSDDEPNGYPRDHHRVPRLAVRPSSNSTRTYSNIIRPISASERINSLNAAKLNNELPTTTHEPELNGNGPDEEDKIVAPPPPWPTRVSPHIQPLNYDITVKVPTMEPYAGFSASLLLHFNLTERSDTITLNSHNLYAFRNISLISANDIFDYSIRSVRILRDQVEIRYMEILPVGQYLLTIGEYAGRLNLNSSVGVFMKPGQVVTTHFQPSSARQLFPCIDHPSVKVPFRLSVVHPTNTVAQSNTISTAVQVVNSQWQKTVFAPTVPLPTYLVSFSVLPDSYTQLSRLTSFGVTIRVHSSSRATALRVVDIAISAFELLADMMEQSLPLNKMDFILVPEYEGGMENWGHILLSKDLATSGDDAHLTYVIAHELAHHWIGNQATVDSWQYVCLQEDLTDYFTYKVVKALLGNDDRYARFRLSKYVEIQLAEDFISPGHTLLMPENITKEMISAHCYLKGVTYLETLESIVGEQYMFKVIQNLVSRYSTFNLTTFTSYFDEVVIEHNITLAQIYQYWFTTGGFPAIYVQNNGTSSQITQYSSILWPLRIASSAEMPDFMFTQTFVQSVDTSPVLVNLNFTSFLRTNYDIDTWSSIFSFMSNDPTLFSSVGRAQLVSDFCYFYAQSQIPGSSQLRDSVIDMVYSKPEAFDLCDWNLYWCYSSHDVSLFTSIIRQLMNGLTNLFEYDSAFGCRNGHAVKRVNNFCDTLFGKKCI